MEKLTGVNLSRPVSVGSVHSIIMREKRMRVGTPYLQGGNGLDCG